MVENEESEKESLEAEPTDHLPPADDSIVVESEDSEEPVIRTRLKRRAPIPAAQAATQEHVVERSSATGSQATGSQAPTKLPSISRFIMPARLTMGE